jgi:hypothetical protein
VSKKFTTVFLNPRPCSYVKRKANNVSNGATVYNIWVEELHQKHKLPKHVIKYQSTEQHSIASRKNADQFTAVRALSVDIINVYWMGGDKCRSVLSACAFILSHEEAKC